MKKQAKTPIIDFRGFILLVVCAICLAAVSCQSLVDRVTPCEVSEQTYEYIYGTLDGHKEVTSLFEVKKMQDKMIVNHRHTLVELSRMIEDEDYNYADAEKIKTQIKEAEAFRDFIIGSEGQQFSVLGLLAGFTGGGFIGRMIKRKGDYSPTEVEEVVARAKRRGNE
ncbi:MAG: hypothetical protein KAS32_05520 [Candidatus Peribacteraceae bacterium]|nr:hypothetical protein [Candidatus Peribacteraceae bacterium]